MKRVLREGLKKYENASNTQDANYNMFSPMDILDLLKGIREVQDKDIDIVESCNGAVGFQIGEQFYKKKKSIS